MSSANTGSAGSSGGAANHGRIQYRHGQEAAVRPIGVKHILVNPRQRGNPLLDELGPTVRYEFSEDDILPDYITGADSCVLILSLKYHRVRPEYIYQRIGKLKAGPAYELTALLIVIDLDNPDDYLRELQTKAIYLDLTVLVAWDWKEAANYIRELKLQEASDGKLIQGSNLKEDYMSQVHDMFGKIRGVNESDRVSLLTQFATVRNALKDGGKSLESVNGFGPAKTQAFRDAVTRPFKNGQ